MRKIIITICIIICTLLPVYAVETEYNDTEINGTFSNGSTWSIDNDWQLTINGDMPEIPTKNHIPYKEYKSQITSVVFEGNVTRISSYAFSDMSLDRLVIPYGVTSIDAKAFEGCRISDIKLPNTVEVINESAFQNASVQEVFIIPDGVREIGDYAFKGANGIETIYIPSSVKVIGYDAFVSSSIKRTLLQGKMPLNTEENDPFRGLNASVLYPSWVQHTLAEDYLFSSIVSWQKYDSICTANVKFNNPKYKYTGSEVKPGVTVSVGDKVLTPGEDYKITYSHNVDVGYGIVTITGINNYEGNIIKRFKITKDMADTEAPELLDIELLTSSIGRNGYARYKIKVKDNSSGKITVRGEINRIQNTEGKYIIRDWGIWGGSETYPTKDGYVYMNIKLGEAPPAGGWALAYLELIDESGNKNKIDFPKTYNKGSHYCFITEDSNYYEPSILSVTEYLGSDYPFIQPIKCDKTKYNISVKSSMVKLNVSAPNKLTYESYSPEVAKVDSKGYITPVKPGYCNISVKAEDSDEYMMGEKIITVVVMPTTPSLTAKAIGSGQVKLTWSKSVSCDRYEIYVKDPKSKRYIKRTSKARYVKGTTHKGLRKGKTYYYKVRSYKVVEGNKIYSNFSSAKKVRVK